MGIPHKKITGRRREPRRHTLQNGIDYNMVQYQNISIDVDKSSNIEIGALMSAKSHITLLCGNKMLRGCECDEYLNGCH